MISLSNFIAILCLIPVGAYILYCLVTYIKDKLNDRRQQFIERSKCIKRNHNICFETALNFGIKK